MKRIYFYLVLLCFACSQKSFAQVVINEVYSMSGVRYNAGAAYIDANFVELYNNGSADVNLSGWSVQTGIGGAAWTVVPLTGIIHGHGHYLIRPSVPPSNCPAPCPLQITHVPNPDDSGSLNLGTTQGKVILCNTSAAQTVADPAGPQIVDKMGYAYSGADCYETQPVAPAPAAYLSMGRNPEGKDTDNNSADFTYGFSPANSSIGFTNITVTAGNNAAEPATDGTFIITIPSAAPAGGVTINYSLAGTAVLNTDYTDPQHGTVTIAAGQTSATVTLHPIDDQQYEIEESIIITLNSATSPYTISSPTATIYVDSDDFNPVSLTGSAYTQDFNSDFAATGAGPVYDQLLKIGWGFLETGSNGNDIYTAGDGSSAQGDTYSFGPEGNTDRAFGTLRTNSVVSTIGAAFVNNTGAAITSFKISYRGEEWRLGKAGRTDRLSFQYSLNATSLGTGTWINVNQLDFITPNTSATVGALNGNAAGNNTNKSFIIPGISIPQGGVFYIRWLDYDAGDPNDGLAVDDFGMETNPADNQAPVANNFFPANSAANANTSFVGNIIFTEPVLKGTGSITVKNLSDNTVAQAIDMNTVTVSADSAYIPVNNLAANRSYYVEVAAGTFTDTAHNSFAGITGSNTWQFATNAALPVTLLGFSATTDGSTVTLNWSTASEQNSKDFIVQRSGDGVSWTNTGTVFAAGNSSAVTQYSYIDVSPLRPVSIYRLLQRDLDDKSTFSSIKTVSLSSVTTGLKIIGNPVTNGILQFELGNAGTISIFNMQGLQLLQKKLSAGKQSIILNNFAKGSYLLKSGGETRTFLVQ